jgi:hypothetical protein
LRDGDQDFDRTIRPNEPVGLTETAFMDSALAGTLTVFQPTEQFGLGVA